MVGLIHDSSESKESDNPGIRGLSNMSISDPGRTSTVSTFFLSLLSSDVSNAETERRERTHYYKQSRLKKKKKTKRKTIKSITKKGSRESYERNN